MSRTIASTWKHAGQTSYLDSRSNANSHLTNVFKVQARCLASRGIRNHGLHTLNGKLEVPLAFVFDIDGVLLRGNDVLPEARRALKVLERGNILGSKIPFILLTNGGGVSEEIRCRALTEQLGVKIRPSQFIQSHTVLKSVVHKYVNSHVLVLGGKGDDVRRVAEGYGFRMVHTSLDIHAWNPSVWPFHELTPFERERTRPFNPETPISAIFVFHDPRNWSLDIQIICDILQSRGYVGSVDRHIHHTDRKPVELVFCNPDLLWRSDFPVARIGQGAFRVAFQGVYKALTGSEYPYVQYGKPTEVTCRYAEQVIRDRIHELNLSDKNSKTSLPHIYMIGDNPDSDVAGAIAAGWSSILVKTGVYHAEHGPPSYSPTLIAQDVEEAVHWAIRREVRGSQVTVA